ncbi:MAG: hypothetical protein HYV07_32580 [Deltaproteobacteria bacterium]|nr:hypothetical protein [Deltaproteobacteria bacterium]
MSGDVRWVFDRLPPSGARRGGDPSEHVFKHDLSTFVREVVQNANDQARRNVEVVPGTGAVGPESTETAPPAELSFKLVELTEGRLDEFLDSVGWTALRRHLDSAARTRGGRSISDALADLDRTHRLLLLVIEDRGTIGLVGDESEGDSHFRALTKDTLFSHKAHESAGGSFGLGKSVLWTFSGLRTVLFNSCLSKPIPRSGGPRLLGRAELPSHRVGRAELSGSGWFGHAAKVDGHGERAESVWDQEAAILARSLWISRPDVPGTSIGILGFRDPASDSDLPLDALARELEAASVRGFWPALAGLAGPALSLDVHVGSERRWVRPAADPIVAPFLVAAQAARRKIGADDDEIFVREISLELPAERGSANKAATALVTLAVAMSPEAPENEPREPRSLASHLAVFRGSGMVVRYVDKRNLAISQRPFHAVLIAGTARGTSEDDLRVERFLRAAEPPGHDEWISTPKLKELYKPGYNKALEALWSRVNEALREIVVRRPRQGARGPDALRRRFPIGGRDSGAAGSVSAFRFLELSACFADGRWIFEGQIEPVIEGDRFEAEISLSEVGEDGQPLELIPIERIGELTVADSGKKRSSKARGPLVEATIEDGRGRVNVEGLKRLGFIGTSAQLPREGRGELALEVTGRVFTLAPEGVP